MLITHNKKVAVVLRPFLLTLKVSTNSRLSAHCVSATVATFLFVESGLLGFSLTLYSVCMF